MCIANNYAFIRIDFIFAANFERTVLMIREAAIYDPISD